MAGASEPDPVSTKRQRIAELAKQSPRMGFTSLNHHLDLIWLVEAYNRTRKDGAPGVDGQTAEDYGRCLLDNLESLLDRAKSGTYWAPPVRRVRIPKGTGTETRPLGIPTLEDKVLQRAVVLALEPIYEQDFLPCSYGFRPGRSAHQALQALWQQVMAPGGCWLVEVDIRKFFDTLDHAHLRTLLQQRVRDGVLLRLIDKWLQAGVLEGGELTYPEAGTPQGGVISPLLANVYLHYVLDEWFAQVVKPRLKGRAFLVRYADDFVMGFACEEDARRVLDVLPKRFGKYGLTIHPDKTRLLPFVRPAPRSRHAGRPVGASAGVVRLPGVHALLEPVEAGALGGEAEDGRQSVPAGGQADRPLVPAEPSLAAGGAIPGAAAEAARSLRVLRGRDWQQPQPVVLPEAGPDALAEVAGTPGRVRVVVVGADDLRARALRLAHAAGVGAAVRSESVVRRAGCLNRRVRICGRRRGRPRRRPGHAIAAGRRG